MIGGFIVGGSYVGDVLVRVIGPSLAQYGVEEGVLADPTLELHDFTGALIASNDDWQETPKDEIEATGIAPSDSSRIRDPRHGHGGRLHSDRGWGKRHHRGRADGSEELSSSP